MEAIVTDAPPEESRFLIGSILSYGLFIGGMCILAGVFGLIDRWMNRKK